MTTYTDRQKACIQALHDAIFDKCLMDLTDDECVGILAYLESTSPVAGFSEATSEPIYETYTGQNGWLEVSKDEYERTKDKYEHRIRYAAPDSGVMTGTFSCPLCGKATPHEHTAEEQVAYRNMRKLVPDWHEGTLMEILRDAGLRFEYRDENVRGAVIAGIKWGFSEAIKQSVTSRAAAPTPVADSGAMESALAELIDKIMPGLDSGNILADARTASDAITRSEPVAWLVNGLNSHNGPSSSAWIRKDNADAAAALLFRESVTPLYRYPRIALAAAKPVSVDAGAMRERDSVIEGYRRERDEALADAERYKRLYQSARTLLNPPNESTGEPT
jgi:hypothetical protein